MQHSLFFKSDAEIYQPRRVSYFEPERIILTRGWDKTDDSRNLCERIFRLYPKILPEEQPETTHSKVQVNGKTLFEQHFTGKRTLVFGEHRSAVRFSEEEENTCPNYWHYSLYGFCPYGCTYCYLAGTPGIKFSPTVKIFININEILDTMAKIATSFTKPTAFYHGKLQDGLALEPLTGYMRRLVPFFAEQQWMRQILLTKTADVENLLDLHHANHTILSWSLQPPEIYGQFEPNTPSISERIDAIKRCSSAGYPVRAVLMPIIPVENWVDCYDHFLEQLLEEVPVQRLTIGSICSYQRAYELMNCKLGSDNPIARKIQRQRKDDGRYRYDEPLRKTVYRHLIGTIKRIRPDLEVGLCLETKAMSESLEIPEEIWGKCNCIWSER